MTPFNRFDEYFFSIYGERWAALRHSLLAPSARSTYSLYGGHATYSLDPASIEVATALNLQSDSKILDLCAAPGGKTLILFDRWMKLKNDPSGQFTSNELSFARRKKLEEVLRTHVPEEIRNQIKVTQWDGEQVGMRQKEQYDRILVDAPCSSERHLLEQDAQQMDWKKSRTENLARRQYSLLCSALLALKPNGELIYSTCSISPKENDEVIARILDRKSDQAEIIELPLRMGQRTRYGIEIFPDQCAGAGPIYYAGLRKNNCLLK
jgi:16S rRNA C967 or C1407 C5-methylase (RsmB/RsmF family)